MTNTTLAGLATQLVMTGRSEAIDLIMATQRGTVTMTASYGRWKWLDDS